MSVLQRARCFLVTLLLLLSSERLDERRGAQGGHGPSCDRPRVIPNQQKNITIRIFVMNRDFSCHRSRKESQTTTSLLDFPKKSIQIHAKCYGSKYA